MCQRWFSICQTLLKKPKPDSTFCIAKFTTALEIAKKCLVIMIFLKLELNLSKSAIDQGFA